MTALDIIYGRKGGRIMLWNPPPLAERLAEGLLVRATCDCPGVRWQYVEPQKIGGRCSLCGGKLGLVE